MSNDLPTPAEVDAALQEPTLLDQLSKEESEVAAKLLPVLTEKITTEVEARKARELDAVVDQLKDAQAQQIKDAVDALNAAAKPPDPSEIQQLLTQEYAEFAITIPTRKEKKEFVIRELPQKIETKMLKTVSNALMPHLKEMSSIDWQTGSNAERIQRIIEIVPGAFDTLAELCAICLDPFGEDGIDCEWVQSNLSSTRIMHVVELQLTACRLRDFFSGVSRLIPGGMTS